MGSGSTSRPATVAPDGLQSTKLTPTHDPDLQWAPTIDVAAIGELQPTLQAPTPRRSAGAAHVGLGTTGALPLPERYEDLGVIGRGGMGEVRRVRDRVLHRTLALKVTLPLAAVDPHALDRFVEEARATAQLQHPNIVPVHDLGFLPDGRRWFTMKEVDGRTLTEVIAEVHAASGERWEAGASGWTLRRLVTAFHTLCRTVAYAHERGVVHRDLKPANTMVGRFGEVYVLDWGLAKVLGGAPAPNGAAASGLISSARPADSATRMGQVAGTPAYMPPEQALGAVDRIDARSDVYALGACLYEILAGRPPYVGGATDVLAQVVSGPPSPLAPSTVPPPQDADTGGEASATRRHPSVPEELRIACERAMEREPADRFPGAAALADAIQDWLDGSRLREQALDVVERARAAEIEGRALAARAEALRSQAADLLRDVRPWEDIERKLPAWEHVAEAEVAERDAALRDLEVEEGLHAAFQFVPDLPEAHAMLAERHLALHAAAEARRDVRSEVLSRALLERHAHALPEGHATRRAATTYLRGLGALTLVTEPPGAEVALFRYEQENRRLVPRWLRTLGRTPLLALSLPMGSYRCEIRHPDCETVRYPFEVGRGAHWDGLAPGAAEPQPVWLPPLGSLGADDLYVPAGWFRAGGDPEANSSLPALRLWCEGFVMERFPVTNARFIEFLDDEVAGGREADALRHAPRERAATDRELGALIYSYADGRFSLRPDADGDMWTSAMPVFQVDWFGARAFFHWLARKTGRPWRLPAQLEWEKAARGVDGRFLPWGDHFDATWCRVSESSRGRAHGDFGPAPVDSYPVDESPYGIRGLGGNAQAWCLDLFEAPLGVSDRRVLIPDAETFANSRAMRTVRGGSWSASPRGSRPAIPYRAVPTYRNSFYGLRGVYSVP